jgi:maltose O-acetyltransferase
MKSKLVRSCGNGDAMFCPHARIGSRSAIGASSVVTRDVPDRVFAAANPCRVIREMTSKDRHF